jgi:hypothetical protein
MLIKATYSNATSVIHADPVKPKLPQALVNVVSMQLCRRRFSWNHSLRIVFGQIKVIIWSNFGQSCKIVRHVEGRIL